MKRPKLARNKSEYPSRTIDDRNMVNFHLTLKYPVLLLGYFGRQGVVVGSVNSASTGHQLAGLSGTLDRPWTKREDCPGIGSESKIGRHSSEVLMKGQVSLKYRLKYACGRASVGFVHMANARR